MHDLKNLLEWNLRNKRRIGYENSRCQAGNAFRSRYIVSNIR